MGSNEALSKILSNLNRKYNHLTGIMDATKQMITAAGEGDEGSFATLLSMRQNAMDSVDKLDADNKETASRLPGDLKGRVLECLYPSGAALTLENPMQTNIFDTNKRINMLLKRIIEADNELNDIVGASGGRP